MVERQRQDEDFVIYVAAQVVDGSHTHVGHEIAGEEASQIAEEKSRKEQQTHEDQRMVFASTGDQATHKPVEVAHQVI